MDNDTKTNKQQDTIKTEEKPAEKPKAQQLSVAQMEMINLGFLNFSFCGGC